MGVEVLRGPVAVVRVRDAGDLRLLDMGMLRSVHISVQHDLDGDQHGRGEYKEQSNRIERCVEGDHGGLIDHDPVQQADGSPAGEGVHSSSGEHRCRRGQPLADGSNSGCDVGAEHRQIADDVVLDQRLEAGHADQAAEQPTRIEETDAGGAVVFVEVAEGDQVDRQEQEAKAEACLLYTSPSPRDS